MKVINFLKKIT